MTTTNVFCKHGVPKGVCRLGEKDCGLPSVAEYTYVEGLSQPAPAWQGLSDNEINDIKTKAIIGANGMSVEQLLGLIVSLTEQALKEKNDGTT